MQTMNKNNAMNRSFIVMFLCLMPLWAFAQEERMHKSDQERKAEREAVQAQKIAFITQEVGLTPAEAEKFWPLYNEMDRKVVGIVRKRNSTKASMYRLLKSEDDGKQGKVAEPAGSSQGRTAAGDHRDAAEDLVIDIQAKGPSGPIEELLAAYMNSFQEENAIRMDYHKKFLQILSAARVARYYLAEERFNNRMIRLFIEEKVQQEKSR